MISVMRFFPDYLDKSFIGIRLFLSEFSFFNNRDKPFKLCTFIEKKLKRTILINIHSQINVINYWYKRQMRMLVNFKNLSNYLLKNNKFTIK